MPRLPRPLLLLLRLVALVWAGYLVLGNAFLNTPLAERAFNRHAERFSIAWSRALTLYPGQILAWDVRARGHVRHVQWQATTTRAHGRIALLPLLRRELRLPSIDALQTTFEAATVDAMMPPRDPAPGGWVIDLPEIRSDALRSARWNELLLDGTGRVAFGMRKQLRGGPSEVRPSMLSMHDARLRRGDDVLLSAAQVDATFAMDRHHTEERRGAGLPGLIRATLQVDGDATAIDLTLGEDKEWTWTARPGNGRAHIDLGFERGELTRGGNATVTLPVSVEIDGGMRRDNLLALGIEVQESGLTLRAFLPQQADGRARLDAELTIAQRTLPTDDLRHLWSKTSGHVDLRWRFDSLRWLSDLLVKSDWLAFDGAGELDAELRVESGLLAPGSRFDVPVVAISTRVMDDRIKGSGHASGVIAAAQGDASPRASVNLVLDRFAIASDDEPDRIYVEGEALRLDLESSGEVAQFRDTLVARLRFGDARVPDLTAYNHYFPHDNLRFSGGSGTLGSDLHLDAEGRVARGEIAVRAKRAALRFSRIDLVGDVAIDTRLARADLARKTFDLDGSTVNLRRVAFRDAGGNERRDWWARVTLTRAHAEWGRPLELDGEASIAMKDVGFLLALFSQKKRFPKWIARVVDAGQADITGQARLRGKSLVLDRLRAENDRFDVRARLELEDAQAHGDLLLRWGVLSIGVELAPEDRDYRMIKAAEWYESRPDLLPALPKR